MIGIVSVAVVAVIAERLIPALGLVICKLLIRLGSNFTLIFSAFISSERFFKATMISFSVRLTSSVLAHRKVYSCVIFTLEVGLTVMPELAGSSTLLPPIEVIFIVPVDVLAPITCTR